MKAFYSSLHFTSCKSSWHGFSQTFQRASSGRDLSWKISANVKETKKKRKKIKTGYNLNQTIKLLDKQTLDYNISLFRSQMARKP